MSTVIIKTKSRPRRKKQLAQVFKISFSMTGAKPSGAVWNEKSTEEVESRERPLYHLTIIQGTT